MKRIIVYFSFAFVLISSAIASTAAAYEKSLWGCYCILCLANPAGPKAVSDCVAPITDLYQALMRGKPFPQCNEAEGAAWVNSSYEVVWGRCEPDFNLQISGNYTVVSDSNNSLIAGSGSVFGSRLVTTGSTDGYCVYSGGAYRNVSLAQEAMSDIAYKYRNDTYVPKFKIVDCANPTNSWNRYDGLNANSYCVGYEASYSTNNYLAVNVAGSGEISKVYWSQLQ